MIVKIADRLSDLAFDQRQVIRVAAGDKFISLARHGNELFAFADKCPHAGACLSEGWMDVTGNIVCPLHRYKFNVGNGRNITGEGYYLKRWPVKTTDDGIFVIFD